jgi:hypothetical protein
MFTLILVFSNYLSAFRKFNNCKNKESYQQHYKLHLFLNLALASDKYTTHRLLSARRKELFILYSLKT